MRLAPGQDVAQVGTWLRDHAWQTALWLTGMLLSAGLLAPVIGQQVWLLGGPTMRYTNSPFPVKETVVHPGDTLHIVVDRCSRLNHPVNYTLSRELVPIHPDGTRDGEIQFLPTVGFELPPGCTQGASLAHQVPPGTPPGRYILKMFAVVPGPYNEEQADAQTQPFTVLGP